VLPSGRFKEKKETNKQQASHDSCVGDEQLILLHKIDLAPHIILTLALDDLALLGMFRFL
jgi:hypothetical protein